MEALLLIALFASNAFALECLYNHRIKMVGAMLVVNLCLTVGIAFLFKQIETIFYILLGLAILVIGYYVIRFNMKKKKEEQKVIEVKDDYDE